VRWTGDIGLFTIIAESALAAGVRRIEAYTGREALAYFNEQVKRLKSVSALLKSSPLEASVRVEALLNDKKKLEKEISDLWRKLAMGGGGAASPEVEVIKDFKFTVRILKGVPANELKPMADELKAKLGSGVVVLESVGEDGKTSLVVGVTQNLVPRINAVDLVKIGAELLGGKGGGGRPDLAQAGGPKCDEESLKKVILEIRTSVAAT